MSTPDMRSSARSFAVPWILACLLCVAALVWGFFDLSTMVMGGATRSFDEAILLAFREPDDLSNPLGPGWVEEMMRDATGLGGVGFLTFLVLSVCVFVWIQGRHRSMWFLLVAVLGGIALSQFLKLSFDRARPDLVPHESIVYNASFPSGHSLMSAIIYLTLAVMIARTNPQRRMKVFAITVAVALTVIIGVSRVYLGVHWPTDVLAGWMVGAGWALLCWMVARWFEARRTIEPGA